MTIRMRDQFFEVPETSLVETLEEYGNEFCRVQRAVNWWLGDLARYAEERFPDTWHQVFPEWVSPGLVDRCKAVATAYPTEAERNPLATWSIHMQNANKPDRIELVQAHVDAGHTSDEARQANSEERADKDRWLLAIDVNYYLSRRWHSGGEKFESATNVADWIHRTANRLADDKGLTDVVCCFDSQQNHRKALTETWEHKYKGNRLPKEPEEIRQLHLVRDFLESRGFTCVSVEGMESDDCMASFSKQFDGKVTIFTADKDLRQCLCGKCNILLDVKWEEDETSGDMMPDYKWLTAADHTANTGIRPCEWPEYQCLMGDDTDNVKGAPGIGAKGAADLIKEFGTAHDAIQAAKVDDERITPRNRQILREFEGKLDVTRKLLTLRTDLEIPRNTRIH